LSDDVREENFRRAALLHNGWLFAIRNDGNDAYEIGIEKLGLGDFSVQTFGMKPKFLVRSF